MAFRLILLLWLTNLPGTRVNRELGTPYVPDSLCWPESPLFSVAYDFLGPGGRWVRGNLPESYRQKDYRRKDTHREWTSVSHILNDVYF